MPTHLAKELVARLGRAVQRATIYPEGHPSVRLATAPLIETLGEVGVPEVLVGFTSDRVFVGTHHRDAVPFELPWLSSRLSARGLSSLRLSPRIAMEEAERLVAWLAGGDDLLGLDEMPAFEGATVARVDFAAVRFRDQPPGDLPADAPEELAWRAIALVVAGDWAAGALGPGRVDPKDVATLVRAAIEQFEGTGVADLGQRLVAAGVQVAALPDEVQAAVKARLATFVTALSPELRGQLLTASARDDPAKLSMLAGLVDHLPSALVLEMIQAAALERGSSSRQFVSFMLKLAGLAATDPQLAEAFEHRCASTGLPRDVACFDAPELRRLLEDLLESREDDATGIAPEEYQRRLDEISASRTPAHGPYESPDHASPVDPGVLARQSARIALLLLADGLADPVDQEACADRWLAALSPALAAWDGELLAGIAQAASRLAAAADPPAPLAKKLAEVSAWFERPAMLEDVLARLDQAGAEPPAELVALARAGGGPLAEVVLARLLRTTTQEGRQRLSRTLAWLEPGVVRTALAEVHRKAPRHARALLAALAGGGIASPAAEAARLFVADGDPALRLDAFRVLFATETSPSRWEAVVRCGLEDGDARVLRAAVEEAGRRVRPGVRLLVAFLERRVSPEIAAAQHHAVRVLAAIDGREARDALRASLAARRTRFDVASRGVAAAIAEALATGGGPEDLAAVRSWRRSPAGWVTRLLGRGRAA